MMQVVDTQSQSQSEEENEQNDMVGVVKIKDGLFICDEFGAQVS